MKLTESKEMIAIWGPVSQAAIAELKQSKSLILIPEHRPFLLGLKHNLPLLKSEGVDLMYCNDNVLGLLFYKGKIKETLLFYKEKKEDGLICICGSLYVSLLSKLHNVPIKTFLQNNVDFSLLDKGASTLEGKDFVLEENKENYIIEASDEFLPQEVLN